MNARVSKELRTVSPVLLAAILLTAALPFRTWVLYGFEEGSMGELTLLHELLRSELGPMLLVLTVCVVSTLAYASEFKYKTMPLLLTQPISRWRIWLEKHLVVLGVTIPLIGIYLLLTRYATLNDPESDMLTIELLRSYMQEGLRFWGLILLTTVLSAGFWALTTRDVVGAVVLNISSQALLLLVSDAVLRAVGYHQGIFRSNLEGAPLPSSTPFHLLIAGAYSLSLLWLSWAKLRAYQDADATSSMATAGSTASARDTTPAEALPSKGNISLLKKELRLHRPVLLLAGAFVVLWILSAVLFPMVETRGRYEEFLGVIIAFYVPLALVLSGCISVAEETRYGILDWHLTFPVSRRRQWALKLGVGALSAGLVGFALPVIATLITFPDARESFWRMLRDPSEGIWMPVMASVTFLVSFWAASVLRDIVRSALATVAAIFVVIVGSIAGLGLSTSTYWLADVVAWGCAFLQTTIADATEMMMHTTITAGTMVLLSALVWHSYRSFVSNKSGLAVLARGLLMLLALVCVTTFWCGDLGRSSLRVIGLMYEEVRVSAIPLCPPGKGLPPSGTLSLKDLTNARELKPATKYWLRNAKLSLKPNDKNSHVLFAEFPNSRVEAFVIPVPPEKWPPR